MSLADDFQASVGQITEKMKANIRNISRNLLLMGSQ
jgi:hypothetical protein